VGTRRDKSAQRALAADEEFVPALLRLSARSAQSRLSRSILASVRINPETRPLKSSPVNEIPIGQRSPRAQERERKRGARRRTFRKPLARPARVHLLILAEPRLASKQERGFEVCIIVIVALRTAMPSRWSRWWQSTTNREWYRRARTPERKRLYRREHFLVAARRKNPVLPSSKPSS